MRKKRKGKKRSGERWREKEVAWRGGGKRRKRHEEVGEALVWGSRRLIHVSKWDRPPSLSFSLLLLRSILLPLPSSFLSPSSFCISCVSRSSSLHIRTPSPSVASRRNERTREGIEISGDRSIAVRYSRFRRFAKQVSRELYFTPFCVPGGSFFEYRGYINLVPSIFVANYCILTRELEFSTTFLSIYLLLLKTRYFYYPVFIIITVRYRINIFGWM